MTAATRKEPLVPRLPGPLSVKIIGLGGVGSIVARYSALFLASLDVEAQLILVDGDAFEPSNASRMFFFRPGNKADSTRDDLVDLLGDSTLMLASVPEFITDNNIDRLIREGDTVLLAVDNHATRKLVSDFCAVHRQEVCLISGGNDGVGSDSAGRLLRGTYGNCQIFVRQSGEDTTPSLTRYHPEIERPADHLPSEAGCAELLATVPQILFTNLTVAASILNTFWLHLCRATHYAEVCFDIADGLMRPVPLAPANRPPVTASERDRAPFEPDSAPGGG